MVPDMNKRNLMNLILVFGGFRSTALFWTEIP